MEAQVVLLDFNIEGTTLDIRVCLLHYTRQVSIIIFVDFFKDTFHVYIEYNLNI